MNHVRGFPIPDRRTCFTLGMGSVHVKILCVENELLNIDTARKISHLDVACTFIITCHILQIVSSLDSPRRTLFSQCPQR